MANWKQLLEQMQGQQDEANAANEQRYSDILQQIRDTMGTVGGTYGDIDELLGTLGKSQKRDIRKSTKRRKAQTEQDLISRGLGSSTIRESMFQRHDEEKDRANLSLFESLSGQRAGALMGRAGSEERLGGLLASMMERRTDQGPDMGQLSRLMEMMGQGGGGHTTIGPGSMGSFSEGRGGGMGMGGGSGGAYGMMSRGSQWGGDSYGAFGGFNPASQNQAPDQTQWGNLFMGGGGNVSSVGYESPFAGMFGGMGGGQSPDQGQMQASAGEGGRTMADRLWAQIRGDAA